MHWERSFRYAFHYTLNLIILVDHLYHRSYPLILSLFNIWTGSDNRLFNMVSTLLPLVNAIHLLISPKFCYLSERLEILLSSDILPSYINTLYFFLLVLTLRLFLILMIMMVVLTSSALIGGIRARTVQMKSVFKCHTIHTLRRRLGRCLNAI